MDLNVVKVSFSFYVMIQPWGTVFVCLSASGPQLCTWDPVCQRRGVFVTVATRCVEHTCHIVFTWITYRRCNITASGNVPCFQESDCVCDYMSQLTPPPDGLRGYCSVVEELALSSDWWVFLQLRWHFCGVRQCAYSTWRKSFFF